MNVIDVVLVAVLAFAMWAGYRRGFILATTHLLAVVASVLVALLGYRYAARLLVAHVPALGALSWPLGFLITWFVAQLVLGAVGETVARAVPRRIHAHLLNRLLGMLPGLVRGVINAAVLSVILLTVPLLDGLSTLTRESKLASSLSARADWLDCVFSPIFEPALQRTIQALTVPPVSRTSIELGYTVRSARTRPDLESGLLSLVNAERVARGRKPLAADPELSEVARDHSRDMLARGYFAHVSPDGKELSDRLHQARLRYLIAGENLALAPTIEIAHQNLMNSPGHRENLLSEQFGRLGIGVLDAGRHGLMVTENFRN